MFTPREKAIGLLSYYWSKADDDIHHEGVELYQARVTAIECTMRVLNVLGIEMPDVHEFEQFIEEMIQVSGIAAKDADMEDLHDEQSESLKDINKSED